MNVSLKKNPKFFREKDGSDQLVTKLCVCFIDIVLFFKINQAVLLSKVLRIMSCKKNYTCTLKLENLIIHGYPLSVLRAVYKSACTNAKFKGSLGKTSVSDLIAMPITMVKISDCSLNQYATCSTYKIM